MSPPAPSLQDIIRLVETDASDPQPLGRLRVASAVVRDLAEVGDAALGHFVDQARRGGHSWSEIGEALGVTKQAAQQKHTLRLPPAASLERLTPRARNVVAAAESVARAWRHNDIGTEHLLLALYHEPHGLAARILVEAGLSADKAETAVAARTKRGPTPPVGQLAMSPKAKEVLKAALTSALELGHNYIGTEHLLLGLSREPGPAGEILAGFGLPQEILRPKVIEQLVAYSQKGGAVKKAVKRVAERTSSPRTKKRKTTS